MIAALAFRRLALVLTVSACLVGGWDSARAAGFHVRGPGMSRDTHDNRGRFQAARAERLQGIRAAQHQQRTAPREPVAAAPQPAQPPPPIVAPEPVDPARSARPGRLTPDERRTLRQQINEAGRDVYRPSHP